MFVLLSSHHRVTSLERYTKGEENGGFLSRADDTGWSGTPQCVSYNVIIFESREGDTRSEQTSKRSRIWRPGVGPRNQSRFPVGLESLMPGVHGLNLEKLGSELLQPVEQRGLLKDPAKYFSVLRVVWAAFGV